MNALRNRIRPLVERQDTLSYDDHQLLENLDRSYRRWERLRG